MLAFQAGSFPSGAADSGPACWVWALAARVGQKVRWGEGVKRPGVSMAGFGSFRKEEEGMAESLGHGVGGAKSKVAKHFLLGCSAHF